MPSALGAMVAAADAHEPGFRQLFVEAFAAAGQNLDVDRVIRQLRKNEWGKAREAVEAAWAKVVPPLQAGAGAYLGSAHQLGGQVEALGSLDGYFDVLNPRSTAWAATKSSTLIVQITKPQVEAIRGIVAKATQGAYTIKSAATAIRGTVGLDPRRAAALGRYIERLHKVAGPKPSPKALAILDKKADRYRARLIAQRALVIARTEVLSATHAGQLEAWQQAEERGLVKRGTLKVWLVTWDDRLCPICRPLHRVSVPLTSTFTNTLVKHPPRHPQCRCAMRIIEPPHVKKQAQKLKPGMKATKGPSPAKPIVPFPHGIAETAAGNYTRPRLPVTLDGFRKFDPPVTTIAQADVELQAARTVQRAANDVLSRAQEEAQDAAARAEAAYMDAFELATMQNDAIDAFALRQAAIRALQEEAQAKANRAAAKAAKAKMWDDYADELNTKAIDDALATIDDLDALGKGKLPTSYYFTDAPKGFLDQSSMGGVVDLALGDPAKHAATIRWMNPNQMRAALKPGAVAFKRADIEQLVKTAAAWVDDVAEAPIVMGEVIIGGHEKAYAAALMNRPIAVRFVDAKSVYKLMDEADAIAKAAAAAAKQAVEDAKAVAAMWEAHAMQLRAEYLDDAYAKLNSWTDVPGGSVININKAGFPEMVVNGTPGDYAYIDTVNDLFAGPGVKMVPFRIGDPTSVSFRLNGYQPNFHNIAPNLKATLNHEKYATAQVVKIGDHYHVISGHDVVLAAHAMDDAVTVAMVEWTPDATDMLMKHMAAHNTKVAAAQQAAAAAAQAAQDAAEAAAKAAKKSAAAAKAVATKKAKKLAAEQAATQSKQMVAVAAKSEPSLSIDQIVVKKLEDASGSNPGGVYQAVDGSKYYVKFYANRLQGEVEHITNQMYRAVGVDAPESVIGVLADGRFAYASKMIDHTGTLKKLGGITTKAQGDSILDGFAADVWLQNWDAVGNGWDNVVQLADGRVVRIDAGGSLIFRATAGLKPDNVLLKIDEWTSLHERNVYYAKAFEKAGIKQAEELGQRLIDQIDRIAAFRQVNGGTFDAFVPDTLGSSQAVVRRMLTERAKLLEAKRADILKTLDRLKQEAEAAKKAAAAALKARALRDKGSLQWSPTRKAKSFDDAMKEIDAPSGTWFAWDGGDVEGLSVRARLVTHKGEQFVEYRFVASADVENTWRGMASNARAGVKVQRLTVPYSDVALQPQGSAYAEIIDWDRDGVSEAIIKAGGYRPDWPNTRTLHVASKDGNKVYAHFELVSSDASPAAAGGSARALRRSASIFIKRANANEATFVKHMKELGITKHAAPKAYDVDAAIEDQFAKLFHRGNGAEGLTAGEKATAIQRARRDFDVGPEDVEITSGVGEQQLVFEFSDAAAMKIANKLKVTSFIQTASSAGDPDKLVNMLLHPRGGLLSSTERFQEGVLKMGMSSDTDIHTGGAQYVFTRQRGQPIGTTKEGTFVFEPLLLKRLDWYAYDNDTFGSTSSWYDGASLSGGSKSWRVSQRDNLQNVGSGLERNRGSETMFKSIVSFDRLHHVNVSSSIYDEVIRKLKARGVTTIGGKPLSQVLRKT